MNEIDGLVETGRSTLADVVRTGGDYLPMLLVEGGDGVRSVVALAGGHPYDMLRATVDMLREMRPVSLALTVDSYMLGGGDPVEAVMVHERYPSIRAAFEAGEPLASEALIVNVVTPTTAQVITLAYVRNPQLHTVTWGERHDSDLAEGRMIDALRAVWA